MAKYAFNTQLDTKEFSGKVFILPKTAHKSPANPQMSEDAGFIGAASRQSHGSYKVARLGGGNLFWHPTSIAEGVEVFGKLSRNEDVDTLRKLIGKEVKIKQFAKTASRQIECVEMVSTIGKVGVLSRVDESDGARYGASATIKVVFKDGSDWWYTPDNLKVVKAPFKVGDLVIANKENHYGITNGEGRLMEVVEVFDKPHGSGDDIRVATVADGRKPKVDGVKYPVNSKYFKLFTKKV